MAHTVDVEGLRQSMTPEQMDGWIAFNRLEPLGVERLIEVLKLGFAAVCGAWGAELEPDNFDPLPADESDSGADELSESDLELLAAQEIERVRQLVARHNAGES